MHTQPDDDPHAAAGWTRIEDDGFVGLVGPMYWKRDDTGAPRCLLPTAAKHRNRRGVVQGGALMTFADRSLGVAVRDGRSDMLTATVQLDIHFIAPVQVGEVVESVPVISRTRGRTAFGRTELRVDGRVVAWATGVFRIDAPGPAAPHDRPA